MPKRTRIHHDTAQNALRVFEQAIGEELAKPTPKPKDPIAVELGRRGGLKGGKALAAKMTPEERVASARRAANGRWNKKKTAVK
ncbi:MAG: hypothetical protein WCA76_00170 [Candidatus Sulfotelmatobacter sp.]|jgi:hypothetical protein